MRTEGQSSLRYEAIYHQLTEDILSGVYPEGTLLPTENALMERFEASRTTIRHAVSLLRDANMVSVRQGHGTEVIHHDETKYETILNSSKFMNISNISTHLLQSGDLRTQHGIVDSITASPKVAEHLSVPEGCEVYRIRRVKLVDHQPFGYLVSYLNRDFVPGLERFSGQIKTMYTTLHKEYNLSIVNAQEHISCCPCGATEALLLNIPIQSPVLFLFRIGFTDRGVLEYTESYYRPDKYEILISMNGTIDYTKDDVLSPDSE